MYRKNTVCMGFGTLVLGIHCLGMYLPWINGDYCMAFCLKPALFLLYLLPLSPTISILYLDRFYLYVRS